MPDTNKTNQIQGVSEKDIFSVLSENQGAGFEDISTEDLYLPRLKILQSLSPELDDESPNHIEGARAGDIVESQSEINFGREVNFIAVKVMKSWIEWYPREDSRGIAAIHTDKNALPQVVSQNFGENRLQNGNRLQETFSFFGYVVFAGDLREVFISFTSTQLRKARNLATQMSKIRMINPNGEGKIIPPLYYQSWILGTAKEKNQKGSWYGWSIKRGKTIIDLAKAGEIEIQYIFDNWKSLAEMATAKNLLKAGDSLQDDAPKQIEANADEIPM